MKPWLVIAVLVTSLWASTANACEPRASKFYFQNGSLELRPNFGHEQEFDNLRALNDRGTISRIVVYGSSTGSTEEEIQRMASDRISVIQTMLAANGIPERLIERRSERIAQGRPDDRMLMNVVEAHVFLIRGGVEVNGCGTPTRRILSGTQ